MKCFLFFTHINIEYECTILSSYPLTLILSLVTCLLYYFSPSAAPYCLYPLPNLMACTRRWWGVLYAGQSWCLVPCARWCRWEDVKPEQRKNVTASPANSLQHNLILPSEDNILLCSKHCVDVVCSVFSKHNSRWQAMSPCRVLPDKKSCCPHIYKTHTGHR